ncbi:MAG: 2-oxoglutarate synthase [Desulfobacteraceae bacterium IS3]|nr:MAG: 2-oxoglutarate synthase [Desulfobacteraceae bacterium IS3]
MNSLLNTARPPVFCPGCSHERITYALDKAFQHIGLSGNQIAIVSDIGCSGLFDTFFNTHALHGLHGRALTYAVGLKLARPELTVIVTMGDGGLGIGGAHLLSACRRNLDITLLILNNFNFGMTGGQFSVTTPQNATVGSGFLNQLEMPMDVCAVAVSAGAAFVRRCSSYAKNLAEDIENAICFKGFSILDIHGICTGRYTKANKLTPKMIEENLAESEPCKGVVEKNLRKEYGGHYRELAAGLQPLSPPLNIEARFAPLETARQEIVILGNAGQRVMTAGEILCLAGMSAGLQVSQKNDYDITVLRGPAISEVIFSHQEIGYTGIENPSVVLAISQEGVNRRKAMFAALDESAIVILAGGVDIPPCNANIYPADFGINSQDFALAALTMLAKLKKAVHTDMLDAGLRLRFKPPVLDAALNIIRSLKD